MRSITGLRTRTAFLNYPRGGYPLRTSVDYQWVRILVGESIFGLDLDYICGVFPPRDGRASLGSMTWRGLAWPAQLGSILNLSS